MSLHNLRFSLYGGFFKVCDGRYTIDDRHTIYEYNLVFLNFGESNYILFWLVWKLFLLLNRYARQYFISCVRSVF